MPVKPKEKPAQNDKKKKVRPRPIEKRGWFLVDAKDKVLGRLATGIATKLMGKDKVDYEPDHDMGSFVVVINLRDLKFDLARADRHSYYHHSKYPGGLKEKKVGDVYRKDPAQVLQRAVTNMIPHNTFRDSRLQRLKIYLDDKHPHRELDKQTNQV